MESIRNNTLLEFPTNIIYDVRKTYGLEKPGQMAEAVNILQKWIQQQNHILKKDFSKEYLEHAIIMCKGSLEKTKKQIDKICTFKTHLPKFFSFTNIKEELSEAIEKAWFFILPKLTADYFRTFIVQIRNSDVSPEGIRQFYYLITIVAEYLKAHDYCMGYIIVLDYTHINAIDVISKLDLVDVQQFIPVLTEGYGARLKGLVFLTESKVIHGFVKIMKTLVSEKIGNRIQVFKDLESFNSLVPKELLPLEYGGPERSVAHLHDELVEVLSSKEHVEYVKEMRNAKTDETKRSVDVFNEQYMGIAGTFRSLHVD